MKARCYNSKHESFPHYGGRGITVCERWRNSFVDFLADVGPRPPGKTLDRWPDKNGNYEPGNVRWATPKQQGRNTRAVKLDEHKAELIRQRISAGVSLRAIANEFDVSTTTVVHIKRGKSWKGDESAETK